MTYALPGSRAAEIRSLLNNVCEVPLPNAVLTTIEVEFVIDVTFAVAVPEDKRILSPTAKSFSKSVRTPVIVVSDDASVVPVAP